MEAIQFVMFIIITVLISIATVQEIVTRRKEHKTRMEMLKAIDLALEALKAKEE